MEGKIGIPSKDLWVCDGGLSGGGVSFGGPTKAVKLIGKDRCEECARSMQNALLLQASDVFTGV